MRHFVLSPLLSVAATDQPHAFFFIFCDRDSLPTKHNIMNKQMLTFKQMDDRSSCMNTGIKGKKARQSSGFN